MQNIGSSYVPYDQNGNMWGMGADSYTWDAQNQLSTATVSGVQEKYLYDANGERVERTRDSISTYFVGGSYEEEDGHIIRSYYTLNGKVVAQRQDVYAVQSGCACDPPSPTAVTMSVGSGIAAAILTSGPCNMRKTIRTTKSVQAASRS